MESTKYNTESLLLNRKYEEIIHQKKSDNSKLETYIKVQKLIHQPPSIELCEIIKKEENDL